VRCHWLKYIYISIYSEREREMCCKCSKYFRESEREREEGAVRCHCLIYILIYIYTTRERERCAVSARNMLERASGSEGGVWSFVKCLECIERERGAL